jgi:decaprenylphospho-beta-D-erythro-pentofuranosid-2-ulose 2-reductase
MIEKQVLPPPSAGRLAPPRLIIGATSSVASNVARLWAGAGHLLVLVGRSETKLAELRTELGPTVLGTRSFDFTEHAAIGAAIDELYEAFGPFDVALLAHGYLGDQHKSEHDFCEALAQIDVNFVSAVAWLIPLANKMEAARKGQLAVITSVAGDRGRPRNYTYGASKGALTLYLQGLRSRLYPAIPITTIKLGPVDTPMTRDHEKNASFITSIDAARGIVRALERKKAEVYVPGFWRPILWAVRVMPEALFQRLKFLSGR